MTANTPIAVIELNIENRGGYVYVSSEDVPGLHLWGDDIQKVCQKIIPAIKLLFRLNRGLDIEVMPASSPNEFPALIAGCSDDKLAERYVMYPAVAA